MTQQERVKTEVTQEAHNAHDVREKLARQALELEQALAEFRRKLEEAPPLPASASHPQKGRRRLWKW